MAAGAGPRSAVTCDVRAMLLCVMGSNPSQLHTLEGLGCRRKDCLILAAGRRMALRGGLLDGHQWRSQTWVTGPEVYIIDHKGSYVSNQQRNRP